VSQISPPIRILLVLAVAVLGVYMLFLRPKDEVVPPATPAPNVQTGEPAVSGPGKAAEAAQGAVEAANGQLQSQESVDGVDTGEATAATGTKAQSGPNGANAAVASAADVTGLPKPIAKAIRKDKVLVLLFWNGKSADDKAVHAALKNVDRWDGRVSVASAPIRHIAKYGRIARGVDVEQSPTVVVVDPNLKAETLVGYVDAPTIDQAVVDALRNTTGVFLDPYLRKVDAVCRDYRSEFNSIAHAYTGVPAEYRRAIARNHEIYTRFAADFAAVKAPKKWRKFKSATVADNKAAVAVYADFLALVGPKPTAAQIVQGGDKLNARATAINKRYKGRMRSERLTRCLN
jgi:hypothetical protein